MRHIKIWKITADFISRYRIKFISRYETLDNLQTKKFISRYKKSKTENNEINKEEKNLTIEEFKTIYDKLVDFCNDFHLSIGSYYEPLLNKDVFDIEFEPISESEVEND